MYNKYFTVEKKLTIAASIQNAEAFASGEVMVDWTALEIPKGASCLRSATVLVRPKGDATPTNNVFAFDLVFSKTNTVSLGTPGAAVTHRPSGDFIGVLEVSADNFASAALQGTAVATLGTDIEAGSPPLVLQGDPTTGDNVGYDTIYVGMIARGNFTFESINTVNETGFGVGAQTVITMDDASAGTTMDCREHFAAGDVLHAQDDAVLGTLSSAAAQAITLTAANTAAIADNDVIFNINPVKIILGLEK
jgi:hypothetical protein